MGGGPCMSITKSRLVFSIDTAKQTVLKVIKAGVRANGIAVRPDGKRVFVSNGGDGNHVITGSSPFGITVYGYGQYTSYWYPGGSNLTRLHD